MLLIHLLPTIAQYENTSDLLAPFSNVINNWFSKLNLRVSSRWFLKLNKSYD